MKPERICIVPEYPASLMTGGLQVQAEETYRALSGLKRFEVELFNWSERRPLADLYHFVGFPPYLHRLTELLRQAGRPYVITKLFGSSRDRVALGMARLRRLAKSHLLRQRQAMDAITGARLLITITDADAEAARIIYSLPSTAVHVVPNGVTSEFFEATPQAWRAAFGDTPFVLSVGAIQPRKGQLLLAQACNLAELPLVLLGPVLPGEEVYAAEVKQAMELNERRGGRWLQHLHNEDELLVSAYAACRYFALLSAAETQPLSVMQAMAAGRPVRLLQAPYVEDALFSQLPTFKSRDVQSIASGLQQAWSGATPAVLDRRYSWTGVAQQLAQIYQSALEKDRRGE